MQDLSIEIAGVTFPNPVVVGPSSLTNSFDKLKQLADAGAGGLTTKLISNVVPTNHLYVAKVVLSNQGIQLVGDLRVKLDTGVKMIQRAKRELKIPIIPNTAGEGGDLESWLANAIPLRDAGADMLELDMGPGKLTEPKVTNEIISGLRKQVGLPIIMKLGVGSYDFVKVAKAGVEAGAVAVSGPNALSGTVPPDINRNFALQYPDVIRQGMQTAYMGPGLNPIGLAFAASIVQEVKLPLISGGGVMNWQNAIERIAIGASVVSLVSAIYLKGLGVIRECTDGISKYLESRKFSKVRDLTGAAAKYYKADVASETESSLRPVCLDPQNLWPNRLTNDWWSSGNS